MDTIPRTVRLSVIPLLAIASLSLWFGVRALPDRPVDGVLWLSFGLAAGLGASGVLRDATWGYLLEAVYAVVVGLGLALLGLLAFGMLSAETGSLDDPMIRTPFISLDGHATAVFLAISIASCAWMLRAAARRLRTR